MPTVVAVAGAFDPVHIGHIEHLRQARRLGDRLVVILNPDDDLLLKKSFFFMTYAERKVILEEFRCVDEVVPAIDGNGTVAETLRVLRPAIFAKGGDRTRDRMPQNEVDMCRKLGIRIVYGVGGGKIQSSSELVRRAQRQLEATDR